MDVDVDVDVNGKRNTHPGVIKHAVTNPLKRQVTQITGTNHPIWKTLPMNNTGNGPKHTGNQD